MTGLNVHGLGFTLFLGGLSALPPLAIDMALPGLPSIQAEFGASPAEAAAVIAIFIAGFSTAPLAVGPLADRYGRKPLGFPSVWAWNSFSAARMAGPAPALPSPLEGVAAKGTDFGAQAFEIARARTELRGPPPAQPDARQPDASQPQNSRIVSGEGGGDSQRGAVGSTAA